MLSYLHNVICYKLLLTERWSLKDSLIKLESQLIVL